MKPSQRQTIPLDLAALRARLQAEQGQQYWRSLEEVAATGEFEEFLYREFPHEAAEWHDPVVVADFCSSWGPHWLWRV